MVGPRSIQVIDSVHPFEKRFLPPTDYSTAFVAKLQIPFKELLSRKKLALL